MPQCGTNTLFPSQPPLNPESGFDFPLHPIQPSVPSYAGPAPVPIVSTSSSSPPHQDRQYRQCLWYIIQNHPDPVTLFRNGIENALTQQAAVQQQLHQNNQTNSNIPSDGPVQFPPELLSPFNERRWCLSNPIRPSDIGFSSRTLFKSQSK